MLLRRLLPPGRTLACVVAFLPASPAHAIIFYDTGDPAYNREVAPGGAYAGSGWQWQGQFGHYLGTMISPRHFLTAKHFGAGAGTGATTFERKAFFTGGGADLVYHTNPNVNGGLGYWNISGTDLRIFEIYGEFEEYAPLYTGNSEAGKELVVFGRGVTRGAAEQVLAVTRGWRWGALDRKARWGVNDVDYILNGGASVGDLLIFDFDPVGGQEECHLGNGDSGGAVFIKDGPNWKLAGINYAVDGLYDTNNICGDGSHFQAAMFDATGFYIGQDNPGCTGWNPTSIPDDTIQSRAYSTRVSTAVSAITPIIQPAIDDAALTSTQRYDNWIAGFGVVSDNQPEENADGDYWGNLIEYLGATDPSEQGGAEIFRVFPGSGVVQFEVRERLDFESLGLSWEITQTTSPTLPFVPVAGLSEISATISRADGVTTRILEIPTPADAATMYRLEVTLGP